VIISLLKHGADINARLIQSKSAFSQSHSETCFHKLLSALNRLPCNSFELLSFLLANGANPNELSISCSRFYSMRIYPLQMCLFHNQSLDCVKLLLEAQADVNSYYESIVYNNHHQEITKETALHIAVKKQDFKLVQLLLDWKSDINLISLYIEEGRFMVRSLEKRVNCQIQGTCLHIAVQAQAMELVRYLILNGATPFIHYKKEFHRNAELSVELTTWELCEENEELKELLEIQFTTEDYQWLSQENKKILKMVLLCVMKNNSKLPNEIICIIFNFIIRRNYSGFGNEL